MPTIKDIARAAGVSHGTVSNVLNKRGGVSYAKIRLVENAAKAMGYAIDEKASLLRRGTAKTLAVLLPSLDEAQYADLYTGMHRRAEARGYSLRLFLTGDMPYLERRALSEAMALKASGLLSVSCLRDHETEYHAPASRGIPLLFLERAASAYPSHTFAVEDAAHTLADAIRRAGDDDGARVCVVAGDPQLADQRAFVAALRSELSIPEENLYANVRAEQSSAVLELTRRAPTPAHVVCASEAIAARVQSAFAAGSAAMPKLYALASLRTACVGERETVSLNYRRMGHDAIEDMLERIERDAKISSRRYAVSRVTPPFPAPLPILKQPLRMLAHRTPTVEALRCLLPRFTRRTGIPVELRACGMDEVFQEMMSPSADTWDVVRLDPSRLGYLGARLFRPLDTLDSRIDDAFLPMLSGLRDEFSIVRGRTYALPFDVAVQMLFCQKPLFHDMGQMRAFYEQTGHELTIPETYADFDRISRFFTRALRADSPILYGAAHAPARSTSVASEFLPRLLSTGEPSYGANGLLNLATADALFALEAYLDSARHQNPRRFRDWSEIARDFVEGQTAMAIVYANHASHFVRNQSANIGMEIGFATVPGRRPLLGGGSLCIGAGSSQPQEAYDFLRWATGEEIAPELVMLGGISACRAVYEHREILDTYPWLACLQDNIRLGSRRPILSTGDLSLTQCVFETILGKHLLAALDGKESPEQALMLAQKTLDDTTAYEEKAASSGDLSGFSLAATLR